MQHENSVANIYNPTFGDDEELKEPDAVEENDAYMDYM